MSKVDENKDITAVEDVMYTWHDGDDDWANDTFSSIEECIADAKSLGITAGSEIYIGRCKRYKVDIDGQSTCEMLVEDAYANIGEYAEGWLDGMSSDSIEELGVSLTKSVEEWLIKHNAVPNFYNIVDVVPVVIGE